MRQTVRALLITLFSITFVGAPYWYYERQERLYRNFRVVTPGVLYRSGQLSREGLARVLHEYGIRTVITLREGDKADDEKTIWEEELCRRQGVAYVRIPVRRWWAENGPAPAARSVKQFFAVLNDSEKCPRPVLVHCFAGEHRTGAFCALYRIECEGWPNEQALQEMKRCGYDNLDAEWDVRSFIRLYEPSTDRKESQARSPKSERDSKHPNRKS